MYARLHPVGQTLAFYKPTLYRAASTASLELQHFVRLSFTMFSALPCSDFNCRHIFYYSKITLKQRLLQMIKFSCTCQLASRVIVSFIFLLIYLATANQLSSGWSPPPPCRWALTWGVSEKIENIQPFEKLLQTDNNEKAISHLFSSANSSRFCPCKNNLLWKIPPTNCDSRCEKLFASFGDFLSKLRPGLALASRISPRPATNRLKLETCMTSAAPLLEASRSNANASSCRG